MKLISINIERDKHYARWMPWVKAEQPDVVCLQELSEEDAPRLAAELGFGFTAFTPLCRFMGKEAQPRVMQLGQGIWSRAPLTDVRIVPYYGGGSGRDDFVNASNDEKVATQRYTLLAARVEGVQIVTTHFPWTPTGSQPCGHQRAAMVAMMKTLKPLDDFVLCGDFNTPRGFGLFEELAAVYKDNIPKHYTSSVDKNLHRVGYALPDYMVDGLFTTPAYTATDVRLVSGVSDHMGVVGEITRI